MLFVTLAFLGVAAAVNIEGYSRSVNYVGEQVLTCKLPRKNIRLDDLINDENFAMDVFGSSSEGFLDLRVKSREESAAVVTFFKGECTVAVHDLEAHVHEWELRWERDTANISVGYQRVAGGQYADPNWFTNYRSYDDITAWYKSFAEANPTLVAFNPSIGKSFEKRNLPVVVMTAARSEVPRFYMQCLIHAREWISGATCNWIANQLIEDYKRGDAIAVQILTRSQVHLVPFTNPDGYEFSRRGDRLWRKSRQFCADPRKPTCFGIDLNRNYDDNWGRGGSSVNCCSDTYMGLRPAEAPEIDATTRYFTSIQPVIGAIDWHAFSQLVMRPFGWTAANSPDETRLSALGQSMAEAIRTDSGRSYRNIKSVSLYVTTGTAGDWFYGVNATRGNGGQYRCAGMTIELRPTGNSGGGFQLPPAEIIPTGKENYAAFRIFATDLLRLPLRAPGSRSFS